MTETEKQQIISLVLQALKTNSLTIEQLTDTTELSKDMYVEVSGGRKISIDLLSSTIAKMVNGDFDALVENVNKIAKDLSDGDAELLKRITGVSDKSNPLTDPFKSIGFCLYLDCYFEKEYIPEHYGKTVDEKETVFEIGYLIGEEEYLGKGIGKIIVKKLIGEIAEIGGKEILADPDEANVLSIRTLLSNGFVKVKDCDYRYCLK